MKFSFVPLRILESEFTSSTAAASAGLAALPITELRVKRAPIFTTLGLDEETLAFPALPMTSMGTQTMKTTNNKRILAMRSLRSNMSISTKAWNQAICSTIQAPVNNNNKKTLSVHNMNKKSI